jgi:hypothetical protein
MSTSDDEPKAKIMDGRAWSEFCDMLKLAGNVIVRDDSPTSELDRAEGFRYLSRLTRAALEGFVEYADPLFPRLHRPVHETAKMGADNPDNYYQNVTIDGAHEYRIFGRRNTVHYLGFGTYAGSYGTEGRSAATGYLEGKDLQIDDDGTFELRVSCRKQSGNWLPMAPDSSTLIVRQTFLDRQNEQRAELTIERIGQTQAPAALTPQAVAQGLDRAAKMVVGSAALFANWAEGFARAPNQLPPFETVDSLAVLGDPNIFYYHGYWKLAADEALVVEVKPPPCDYWNFQLNNYWMESLDYRYHRIAINKHDAVYAADGTVRIVVAHRDPGVENWLETTRHMHGTMCFRWVRADHHPQPRTRVVKVEALHEGSVQSA